MSSSAGSVKVIVFALLANLGISLAKFGGAFVSGSASLLAEAIHSLVDCTNQVLLLFGSRASQKAPTDQHPLGYGREAFFWSFIVAILLFSLGGVFAIYEGLHHLSHPEEIRSPMLSLGILVMGIFLEWISFSACMKEIRLNNPYGSLTQWFRKTTAAELLVIFTEDAAAMFGLVIAALCISLAWITGDPAWDARGSILVGSLLVVVAVLLGHEIKSLLIGEAPSNDLRPVLDELVARHIPGGSVLRMIALQVGNHEILLSYKIHPGSLNDSRSLINAINTLEAEVKKRVPEIRWQFVEPDYEA